MSEIKVVPCAMYAGKWDVAIGGETHSERCYKSEAEALEKAAELEASGFSRSLLETNIAPTRTPELRSKSPYARHAPNPEPVEQAAPPRPLESEICQHENCGKPLSEHAPLSKICPNTARNSREAGVPYQYFDRVPAAIEQARPQPPTDIFCSVADCKTPVAKDGDLCGTHEWERDHPNGEFLIVHDCKHGAILKRAAAAEPAPERTPRTWELKVRPDLMPETSILIQSSDGFALWFSDKDLEEMAQGNLQTVTLKEFIKLRAVAVPEPAKLDVIESCARIAESQLRWETARMIRKLASDTAKLHAEAEDTEFLK